jgi:hypothetical protein
MPDLNAVAGDAARPLDADWLTGRLRARGMIEAGSVVRVAAMSGGARGGTSEAFALEIGYSADAAGECPRRLFCKHTRPDRPQDAREAVFYRELAPDTPGQVAPVCVDAAYDEASRRVFLLLEDLSLSHRAATPDSSAPGHSLEEAGQAVDVLARLHRRWWQDRGLVERFPFLRPLSFLELDAARCRQAAPAFREAFFSRLDGEASALLARALEDGHARVAERVRGGRGVTLLHGDPHPANVLLPRAPGRDGARLVDWNACTTGLAAVDIAYALLWLGDDGAVPAAAAPLIERYCAALGHAAAYAAAECAVDLGLAVELQLLRPLRMYANGAPPYWCGEVLRRALAMVRAWRQGA